MPENMVWFITGCSSGIGRSIAVKALESGHRVIATSRNTDNLQDIKNDYGEQVLILSVDVTDSNQISEAVNSAVESFGSIDVLVNNAGYGLAGALEEFTDEEMHENFNTNFWGAVNVTRQVLPVMRENRSGHIINISAAAAINNEKGFSIYAASKAALDMVGEALCWELRPHGIKVTNVVPGPFRTDFINRSLKRAENRIEDYDKTSGKFIEFLGKIDGKQPGDPEKAADAVLAITKEDKPPLYLYLGEYAYGSAEKKIKKMRKYLDDWEVTGLKTDYD